MVQLTFKVLGATQMARNLRVLAREIPKLEDFFAQAIDIIAARSDSLWASSGSNVARAEAWAPLAPSTLKARERRWGYYKRSPSHPGILRWTGTLQDRRNKHVSDRSGKLTFLAPYGIYHQQGGKSLPRRVIVDLSDTTNTEIHKALQKHIHEKIGIFGRQV